MVFPWRYVIPYWLAQFLGATAASALQLFLFPDRAIPAHFGATVPHVGIAQAIGIEIVLTFFLMFASLGVGTDQRVSKAVVGISIGFVVLSDGLFGNFLTGGSMNPARSLGPALIAGGEALSHVWLYFVGPVIGAAIAVLLYQFIRESEKTLRGAPEALLPLARTGIKEKLLAELPGHQVAPPPQDTRKGCPYSTRRGSPSRVDRSHIVGTPLAGVLGGAIRASSGLRRRI